MKQKYTIHLNYHASADIDVVAESEEEAKSLAIQRADNIPGNFIAMTLEGVEATEVQDLPDVDSLRKKAEEIIRDCAEQNIFYNLPGLQVTAQVYDEGELTYRLQCTDSVTWNSEYDEIEIETEEGVSICMSEIAEAEQINILNKIANNI